MRNRAFCTVILTLGMASCANQISLPVSMKTSSGELYTGMTVGPPFNGVVRVQSTNGTTCSGAYTTDQYRTIRAPGVSCSDGRTATFTAKLESDLTSARGTARFSDGSTADVGVGSRATAIESGSRRAQTAAPSPITSGSGNSAMKKAKQLVSKRVQDSYRDYPATVQFLSNKTDGGVGKLCGYIFATHPSGTVSVRRFFVALVQFDKGEPTLPSGINVQPEGRTYEDFKPFCLK